MKLLDGSTAVKQSVAFTGGNSFNPIDDGKYRLRLSIRGDVIQLHQVERELAGADSDARLEAQRRRSRPVADALHHWMGQQRRKIPDGSATARAIEYCLQRWQALTRFIDDGDLPLDNS